MKYKIGKIALVIILIFILLFSICPKAFATNGNEMSISSKDGIGNTIEIISGNTNSIRSESVADVVSYLTGQNITVNSITNHKGVSVDLTSTALIGTGYVLDTNNGNYSVIVYGDANGDGEADAGDMKIIIDNFLGIKQASPIAKIAVDVYKDGDLDAADLKQVLDSFLGNLTGSILKTTSASNPTPTPTPTQVSSNPQIKVDGEIITLTPENAPEYYGRYITNYNVGATRDKEWRLFFVDFEGKYGETGKIYLIADYNYNRIIEKLDTTLSVNSTSALNKMKQMNPDWAANDGIINTDSEKAILWLCDESQWSDYKDTNKADSVMGTPSVEMFIDSYNQYFSKKQIDGYQYIKCKAINQGEDLNSYSYRYAKGIDSEEYSSPNGNSFNIIEEDTFYYYNLYLASPSDTCYETNFVNSYSGKDNWFSLTSIKNNDKYMVCPVVGIKSGVVLENKINHPDIRCIVYNGNISKRVADYNIVCKNKYSYYGISQETDYKTAFDMADGEYVIPYLNLPLNRFHDVDVINEIEFYRMYLNDSNNRQYDSLGKLVLDVKENYDIEVLETSGCVCDNVEFDYAKDEIVVYINISA